jgi:hypothetical protein
VDGVGVVVVVAIVVQLVPPYPALVTVCTVIDGEVEK